MVRLSTEAWLRAPDGPVGTRLRATITSRRRPMDMLLETTVFASTTSVAGRGSAGR